jgi:GH24 family phage-related lysozyme (muramidase)
MDNNTIDIRNHEHMSVVAERIKDDEGKKNIPYQLEYKGNMKNKVKEDFYTVGYGHRIYGKPKEFYSNDEIESLFEQDFQKAKDGAYRLTKDFTLKPEAFGVLTEMVYQMGEAKVATFKKTLNYLKEGNYKEAGLEVLRGNSVGTVSNWSLQTPKRADRASKLLISLSE